MVNPFSSILRGVNREPNSSLNILCINENEYFQSLFQFTNHNFYFINSKSFKAWNKKTHDVPSNCMYLYGNSIEEQLKPDIVFDLIICQNRSLQNNILSQIALKTSCPIISIDNELPNINYNQFYTRNLAEQTYNQSIFSSNFVAESWGFDPQDEEISVLNKFVNTDYFNGYTNNGNQVLVIQDSYEITRNVSGFDNYLNIRKKFNTVLFGNNPGISKDIPSLEKRRELYQKCAVYVNTHHWSSCPYNLLEAMSTGCPVVAFNSSDISDYINHEENGFLANNEEDMIVYIERLLQDKNLRENIGQKARKSCIEKFNINKFNEILYNCIDKPCKIITQ